MLSHAGWVKTWRMSSWVQRLKGKTAYEMLLRKSPGLEIFGWSMGNLNPPPAGMDFEPIDGGAFTLKDLRSIYRFNVHC